MQRATQISYQQALGAIGRYMDQHRYEDLVLCELGDGYVARMMRAGSLVEAIPFATGDIIDLVRAGEATAPSKYDVKADANASFVRRVLGGYHDFLSALGRQCDVLDAHSVLIVELRDTLVVAFQKAATSYEIGEAATSEYMYDEVGLRTLINNNAGAPRS